MLSVTLALSGVTNLAAVAPVFKKRSQGQMELCPRLPALEATLAASLLLYGHQNSYVDFMAFATESPGYAICPWDLGDKWDPCYQWLLLESARSLDRGLQTGKEEGRMGVGGCLGIGHRWSSSGPHTWFHQNNIHLKSPAGHRAPC